MQRLLLAALLAASVAGCGYRLITADAEGPVEAVQLVAIDDLTPQGDLGLHAVRRLRDKLAGRRRPALSGEGPGLGGVVRAADEAPLAFDATHHAAVTEVGVEFELRLVARDGTLLWSSGPIRRTRPCLRGATPLEGHAARRQARLDALADAVDDALARFLAQPPLPVEETP
ncbi:MAG: hypothetical protein KC620_01815 [Myxococcales bacterium]|nr:hypothetical protein [Myxococcales bacterium]